MQTRPHMTLERRNEIQKLVLTHGSVRVGDLAERFQVSEMTIRTDLSELERQGLIRRDRGGALPPERARQIHSLARVEERTKLHEESKQAIARAAAQFVSPGDTIFLDAGTTVRRMIPLIAGIEGLRVLTNALDTAMELGATTSASILLLGGQFSRESASTTGHLAELALKELSIPRLFLGTQAFDMEGLTDTTFEIAHVKKAMIAAAREVILLADSSKWGIRGVIKVAPLSAMRRVITDGALPEEAVGMVRRQGIELIQARPG